MVKALAVAWVALGLGLADHRAVTILGVSPRVSFAPASIHMMLRVEPNAENRNLIIEASADEGYRRSDVALEGETAAMIHVVEWRELSAGDYLLIASVISASGELLGQDRAHFLVID